MAKVLNSSYPPPVSRKGIWGWMLFDWAAQPFHTLIITFIFAPYFASAVAPDPVRGQELWGYASGIGGLLIALLAPIFGALSDTTGAKKPWIFSFSLLAAASVWSLWWLTPNASDGQILLGLCGLVLALIGFEFAAVFNNAMMPGLVPRDKLGALSGNAWALGYCGGLICLVGMLLFMATQPESGKTLLGLQPLFGLDAISREGDRAAAPLTAIWYLLFILPLFLFTPDAKRLSPLPGALKKRLADLYQTLRSLPTNTSLFAFLGASMFYRDALNGLFAFGGIYASGVLGWTAIQLGVFGILASIAGVLGCLLAGWADNRIGTKPVINTAIIILLIACIILISTAPGEVFFITIASDSSLPDYAFYLGGCLVGSAGGALQAASRPLLIDQAPPDKMGEAFGLYALSGRATAFIAPLSIAFMTGLFDDQRIGITPVLALFVIGLLLLVPVRSRL